MERRTRLANGERSFPSDLDGGRVPFWAPASNYYLLAAFGAGIVFLIVWVLLYDGLDDTPWVVALIAAAGFSAALFLFREVVLKRMRQRAVAANRLSHHLRLAAPLRRPEDRAPKVSVQQNERMLRDIRSKSEAAKVLNNLAAAHKEVSDLCEQYLSTAAAEMSEARPGSPRIPAFRRGAKFASVRHRSHMLRWAEIKARTFTSEAGGSGKLGDKIGAAEDALDAVEQALSLYPDEPALGDSRAVLRVFLVSARIKNSIEKAEHATANGSNQRAVDHYRAALSDLNSSELEFAERDAIHQRIQSEIGRISKLADAQV